MCGKGWKGTALEPYLAAFSRYIESRWGAPYPVGEAFKGLLCELFSTTDVYKKIVGNQLVIEGMGMGTFAHFHSNANDPVLKRMLKFVMADEAFHHKAGKIWANLTIPSLTPEEHAVVEDWAAECFQTILHSVVNTRQKKDVYAKLGLDWEWVRAACREVFTEEDRRAQFKDPNNVYRVVIKTLVDTGIITDRTRAVYANWVDLKELRDEGEVMIGDAIAEDGAALLRRINKDRKPKRSYPS